MLTGQLCRLEPLAGDVPEAIDAMRAATPEMGGARLGDRVESPYGAAMLIVDARTGAEVGVIDNHPLPGYPGVANVNVFVDRARARAGVSLEAFAMYNFFLFANGVEIVHVEVLEFNRAILGILRKIGMSPQARYRSHAYVAGRWWDVVVFGWDLAAWERAAARYSRMLPGGGERARILG
jgi:RimJ/RimL family protein N-acetyltransferase